MMDLLIATANPGKMHEFQELLAGLPTRLLNPAELGLDGEVEETGQTYAENARLKAEALARAAGLITLGDDSGVEVAALGGAPGLFSHRYAGPGASDADRRRKLLEALEDVAPPRAARFVCWLAVCVPGSETRLFEGIAPGEIGLEERGSGGFGYDPIFYLPEQGATMAELPRELKNQLSHRARAVQAARGYLEALLAGSSAS
ncbi:MAG: RdgB/HAM1 family non-canonical purine NTP pyrophosphatase [Anaerolineales bacterium]